MADHDSATDSSSEKDGVMTTITSRLPLLKTMHSLSDFKIICKGEEWPVHKTVLVMHSSMLEQACAGDLKELDLSDYTARTVASLVQFLYNLEYVTFDRGFTATATDQHPGPCTFHVKMFLLGDHLGMIALKSEAEKQLLDRLVHSIGMSGFDLARACAAAYENRDIARPVCIHLVAYLVGCEQPFNGSHRHAELEKAIKENPDFALDLARATKMMLHAVRCEADEQAPTYRCPNCVKIFLAFIFVNDLPFKCYYRCGAEYTGEEWDDEYKQDSLSDEYTNRELGVAEVEEGTWWRD